MKLRIVTSISLLLSAVAWADDQADRGKLAGVWDAQDGPLNTGPGRLSSREITSI